MEVELETLILLVEKRGRADDGLEEMGVGGAWAMCAMPFVPRSIEINVVGLVLAVTLLKVRGSDKYEDEDLDGAGEGGEVGGKGRMDASSSAASGCEGDQVDERDERGYVDRPKCETSSSISTTGPLSE